MFLIKLAGLILTILILSLLSRIYLRRLFNIRKERENWFAYKHFNQLHKYVERIVKFFSIWILVILLYFLNMKEASINAYLLTVLFLILLQMGVKAFFEWRYSKVHNLYILSLSDMLIYTIFILGTVQLNLLQ